MPTTVGRDAEFITIERPIRDIAVDPGEQRTEQVLIQNQTSRALLVNMASRDLGTRPGGSRSLDVERSGSQPRGAGSWLTIAGAAVRIAPYTQKSLPVRIAVPVRAAAGAWGGAALITVSGTGPQANVALQQETSVDFLFTVRGALHRDLRVQVQPNTRFALRGGRLTWRVRVDNRGDAFESFGGVLRVAGRTGGTTSRGLQSGVLFPGERRDITVRTNLRPAPDVLTATARVTSRGREGAGADARDIHVTGRSARVYVLPWWLPLLILAGVVVIGWRMRTRARVDWVDDEPFAS